MSQSTPQVCQLSHPGFRMLGEPVFRLSEGASVPSMVVQLEKQDAVLPLQSVAREFGIQADSPDGQMMHLIEQALDFVIALRLGDALPSELNGGEASWKPTEQDRILAGSRVRHNLVRCVSSRLGQAITLSPTVTPAWEDSQANRELVKQAATGAADLLEGVDVAEVTERVAALCEEMACIETMRRTLIRGSVRLREKLFAIGVTDVPVRRRDTVKQVQSLARRGLKAITDRFDQVDAHLDNMLTMLRDMPNAVAWLRRQRDWLFRTSHAWEAVFADWTSAPSRFDEFMWKVVERSYLFMAPRFMSFQEWTSADSRPKQQGQRAAVW